MRLHGIMMIRRRGVGLIQLDRRRRESSLDIAMLSVRSRAITKHLRLHKISAVGTQFNIERQRFILDSEEFSGQARVLQGLRHNHSNELSAICYTIRLQHRHIIIGAKESNRSNLRSILMRNQAK